METNVACLLFLIFSLLYGNNVSAEKKKKDAMAALADVSKMLSGTKEEEGPQRDFTREFSENTENRPTKCHVCRVLAQELLVEMNQTADIKKEYFATSRIDGKEVRVNEREQANKIDYKTSEIRIIDILDTVCNNMYNYRVHAGPPFPYLKGVKSLLRQALDELATSAGLPLDTKGPEESLDDPTHEIARMFSQCQMMVEEYEDDIMDWYMKNQDKEIIDYLCAQRILKTRDRSCLYESTEIPEGFTKPHGEDEDRPDGKFAYKSQHSKEL